MKSTEFFELLHSRSYLISDLSEMSSVEFPPKSHLHKVHKFVRVPPRVFSKPTFRDLFRTPTICHLRHFVNL